jgi:hypothetical protein
MTLIALNSKRVYRVARPTRRRNPLRRLQFFWQRRRAR